MLLALEGWLPIVGGGLRGPATVGNAGLRFCVASNLSRSHSTARCQQWLRCCVASSMPNRRKSSGWSVEERQGGTPSRDALRKYGAFSANLRPETLTETEDREERMPYRRIHLPRRASWREVEVRLAVFSYTAKDSMRALSIEKYQHLDHQEAFLSYVPLKSVPSRLMLVAPLNAKAIWNCAFGSGPATSF